MALALLGSAGAAQGQDSLAAAVKAAYLYKFAPFVQWPPAPSSAQASPFAICVIGKDPFGSLLDRAVGGQRVGERPIVVRRLAGADPHAPCQISFLGGTRTQPVGEALRLLKGTPVLTVTDGASPPGIVDFALFQGRVRFRVDEQAAAENGLAISSKLLGLALSVKRSGGPVP